MAVSFESVWKGGLLKLLFAPVLYLVGMD